MAKRGLRWLQIVAMTIFRAMIEGPPYGWMFVVTDPGTRTIVPGARKASRWSEIHVAIHTRASGPRSLYA
jgi:hypothetical protein